MGVVVSVGHLDIDPLPRRINFVVVPPETPQVVPTARTDPLRATGAGPDMIHQGDVGVWDARLKADLEYFVGIPGVIPVQQIVVVADDVVLIHLRVAGMVVVAFTLTLIVISIGSSAKSGAGCHTEVLCQVSGGLLAVPSENEGHPLPVFFMHGAFPCGDGVRSYEDRYRDQAVHPGHQVLVFTFGQLPQDAVDCVHRGKPEQIVVQPSMLCRVRCVGMAGRGQGRRLPRRRFLHRVGRPRLPSRIRSHRNRRKGLRGQSAFHSGAGARGSLARSGSARAFGGGAVTPPGSFHRILRLLRLLRVRRRHGRGRGAPARGVRVPGQARPQIGDGTDELLRQLRRRPPDRRLRHRPRGDDAPHPPYYPVLLPECGFSAEKDLWSWEVPVTDSVVPESIAVPQRMSRLADAARAREGVVIRQMDLGRFDAELARVGSSTTTPGRGTGASYR